jgi:hypothetical protein
MRPPATTRRFAAIVVPVFLLTGCASMDVSSYVARGVTFEQYRTYNWAPTEPRPTGDPRLDNNPFFHDRIRLEVEKQLAARGFEKTESQTPELLLHYHASAIERLDLGAVDPEYERPHGGEPYVFEAGTILLDFVDVRTDQIIWRGWARSSLDGVVENQTWMEERIDEAVRRILATLPSRL